MEVPSCTDVVLFSFSWVACFLRKKKSGRKKQRASPCTSPPYIWRYTLVLLLRAILLTATYNLTNGLPTERCQRAACDLFENMDDTPCVQDE